MVSGQNGDRMFVLLLSIFLAFYSFLLLLQSRTQSPRASWPAGERPERLWDNQVIWWRNLEDWEEEF